MTDGPAEARGFDKTSAAMALVTAVTLAWAAWLRFGPPPPPEPPAVGSPAPALRLLDPATSEPLVLLGLRGKVVWITFVGGGAPPSPGTSDLSALEAVWKRFRPRAGFAMAALAVEADRPDRLRAAVAASGATVPAYLASPETCRAYGADPGLLPLHVLLDPTGRVAAVAQGRGAATLGRLAERTERWLSEVEPKGKARFAWAAGTKKTAFHVKLFR